MAGFGGARTQVRDDMDRRKFVIGVGSLAAGGAAAMGTGAFSAAQLDNRNVDIGVSTDESALIGLRAGEDELVTQDSDGKLDIDFTSSNGGDGVNPDSTYQVGAIGTDGESAISDYVDEETDPAVSTGDILYGGAVESGEPTIDDAPAFSLLNNSENDYNVELFYDGDGVSGVTVLLVGDGPDNDGAAVFDIDESNEGDGRLGGFPLPAGNEFDISMLVVAETDAATGQSFDEDIIVQAGKEEGESE